MQQAMDYGLIRLRSGYLPQFQDQIVEESSNGNAHQSKVFKLPISLFSECEISRPVRGCEDLLLTSSLPGVYLSSRVGKRNLGGVQPQLHRRCTSINWQSLHQKWEPMWRLAI